MLDQPACHGAAQASSTANKQVASLGVKEDRLLRWLRNDAVGVLRHRDDNLSDVGAVLEMAECLLNVGVLEVRNWVGEREQAVLVQVDVFPEHPADDLRLLAAILEQVEAEVRPVPDEAGHVKTCSAKEVSLAELKHGAVLGHALPARVEEIARKRVEDEVDTAAAGQAQHAVAEAVVARAEDALPADETGVPLQEELDLLLAAHRRIHLNVADPLADFQRRQPETAASGVHEH
jgi:hypothetical protein